MSKNEVLVKSSSRTIQIFECFAVEQRPMRLGEIAKRIECVPSSAFALLPSLEAQGYLDYDADAKKFIPTLRSALLGAWVNDRMISDRTILKLMMDLQAKTMANVVLGALSALSVQYIHVIRSPGLNQAQKYGQGALVIF